MILCDTGILICLVDRTQPRHHDYRQLVIQLQESLTTNWACLTEVMYLALRQGGWAMQKQVAQYLLDDLLTIYDIRSSDYGRLFELMEQYRDRPMDLADATLVLTAEKTRENRILTLDSDFLFYRIVDQKNFNIIQI
ncbi:MAG: PIN domain-containing protein [Pseudanabaenales cyanobacterium]|nr:PIN domain-containing protein [Pseudanabaenales cyanobacterium]